MATFSIVEHLDVLEQIGSCFLPGSVPNTVHTFAFEDPRAVLLHAWRLPELEPTEEDAALHQIEALLELGDRNAAMRAYHRYSDAMERELGVAPGAAIQRLYRRIRGGSAPPAEHRHRGADVPVETPASGAPFVGREQELTTLRSTWSAVQGGGARLVLVSGEPGIGKARLAYEFGRGVAAGGHPVITARAYEAAGRLPWGPVVDLLRTDAIGGRLERLDPVWTAELSRLVPELNQDADSSGTATSGDPAQRHRLFDAVKPALVSENPA